MLCEGTTTHQLPSTTGSMASARDASVSTTCHTWEFVQDSWGRGPAALNQTVNVNVHTSQLRALAAAIRKKRPRRSPFNETINRCMLLAAKLRLGVGKRCPILFPKFPLPLVLGT
ncbi:hypothetical protein RB195_001067 [Necator americanus]|uniref:Uncharacterized protein n=1 Tax=Necator americanus TaxID=51031 RepID=A0ABR1DCJ0_NECAM